MFSSHTISHHYFCKSYRGRDGMSEVGGGGGGGGGGGLGVHEVHSPLAITYMYM